MQQKIVGTERSLERRSVRQDVGLSQDFLQSLMRLRQMIVPHVQNGNVVKQVVVLVGFLNESLLWIWNNIKKYSSWCCCMNWRSHLLSSPAGWCPAWFHKTCLVCSFGSRLPFSTTEHRNTLADCRLSWCFEFRKSWILCRMPRTFCTCQCAVWLSSSSASLSTDSKDSSKLTA